ncbi:winged helix-turn-helix transcriptional regulator [Streptomyces kaniharaensis]|uniref:Winged helix-turn-helix transcriptional regulator n=2 Tax=Streptomyces kaniharaensis TaxID=212423 RepID=A0A6N7KK00_9ACTN|nr:winged helix-turn-helix transcriptional regulator [Streptomyces kaniharaensis]
MRFAVSPMWEVGPSLRLLASRQAHPVHRPWVEQVRPRVAAAGLDRGWLAELVPPSGYVPDFINPAPAGPAPTLADELAAIRATPAERVRRDLDRLRARRGGGLGPRLRALYADPATGLVRLTEAVEAYWDVALAPYWARIRALLDADVLHRARRAAEHGTASVLNDLHAEVRWAAGALRLDRRPRGLDRRTAGSGLLLIPSAFTGPGLFTRVAPPDPPQLAYPARGIGTLWAARPGPSSDALAAVLGRSRTLLLIELAAPASTTELAHRTGLSPSAVSQYLTALRDAGLVSAHRAGRSVLYARTAAAEAVLAPLARAGMDR